MPKRSTPADTPLRSSVIYPSSLFSLEKDEVFPYERFAYNIFRTGVEALHSKGLPERLIVDFTRLLANSFPWLIAASITFDLDADKKPTAFQVATPEVAPAILYLFTAVVAEDFFLDQGSRINPKALLEKIHLFADGVNAGARAYRDKGFAYAIRAAYEHLGLSVGQLSKHAYHYDLLTQLIANHEIAHAYIQQVTRQPAPTQTEKIAFELIADMVATAWFYRKMVVNTPDTDEYRSARGMNSYAETILANSLTTLRCQQALLVLMAIAAAQRAREGVNLSGAQTHPPGMQRHMLQHTQLYTLIRSNFASVLSENSWKTIEADWDLKIDVLVASGVICKDDVALMTDPSECDAVEVAADLIEELRIMELEKLVPFLRDLRRQMIEALNKQKPKR